MSRNKTKLFCSGVILRCGLTDIWLDQHQPCVACWWCCLWSKWLSELPGLGIPTVKGPESSVWSHEWGPWVNFRAIVGIVHCNSAIVSVVHLDHQLWWLQFGWADWLSFGLDCWQRGEVEVLWCMHRCCRKGDDKKTKAAGVFTSLPPSFPKKNHRGTN